jgi:transposase
MEVIYPRAAGLDIHLKLIVACRITPGEGSRVRREVRSFGTTTAAIGQMAEWLVEGGVTHVAMEATGVYWKSIYNLLENRFELILANAQHIKAVPGRKTDVQDSEWIADLLRHGLIRGSFVPDRVQRELRELTRHRTTLVDGRAQVANRIQKTLEGANVKLASVASNVLGQSARAMLEALVDGEVEPSELARHARGRMKSKKAQLEEALEGSVGPHQRFLLRQLLTSVDHFDGLIAEVNDEITRRLAADSDAQPLCGESTVDGPPRSASEALARLDTIPGVGTRLAEIVLSEVGRDMHRFPSAAHLASWAGLCPGHNESGGKRLTGRTRRGSPALRRALVEAAHAAAKTRTYLGAQFRRLAARRGAKRAAVAVAHSILVIIFNILRAGGVYQDLGHAYFDQRDKERVTHRLVQRLRNLGMEVELTAAPAP